MGCADRCELGDEPVAQLAPLLKTGGQIVSYTARGRQPLSISILDPVPERARRRDDRPAWKSLPSGYLVAQYDQALPPEAQRMSADRMGATTAEVPSGHLAMVSRPADVVKLTESAGKRLHHSPHLVKRAWAPAEVPAAVVCLVGVLG